MATVEEDTVPPVTLTAATPCSARTCPPTAAVVPLTADLPQVAPVSGNGPVSVVRAAAPATSPDEALTTAIGTVGRPRLRLISSPASDEIVHGFGGPASCACRECTMARHPAAMPRLTVVR
jgi:hypothetical protein